jgi:hypothetical protein
MSTKRIVEVFSAEPRRLAVDRVEDAHRVGEHEARDPCALRAERNGRERDHDVEERDDVWAEPPARQEADGRPDERRIDVLREDVRRALVVGPEEEPLGAPAPAIVGDPEKIGRQMPAQAVYPALDSGR